MHLRKYLAVDQSPTQQPQKAIIDDDIQHLDQRYSEGKEEFHSEISSLQNQSDKLATQLSKEQIFRDAISTSLGQQSHLVKTQFGHLIDKLKTGQNEVENRLTNMINERIESTHSVIERESNEYKTTLLNYKQFLERDFPEIHRSIGSESTQRSEMDDRLLEELYSDIQYLNEQMEAERTERDNKEEELIKKIEAMNLEISNMIKTEQAEREKSQEALLRLLESACTKLNKSIDLQKLLKYHTALRFKMSSSYVTNNYNGPLIIESTLKKAKNPNSSSRFFSKFNTRYFILDLINGSFFYLKQKNSKQIEKSYNLLDISGFDFNPKDYDKCSWKYVFSIQLQGLVYKLYTDSLGVHKTWTNALMCLLHLNSTQMYNNTLTQPFSAPSTAESHSQVFQSRAFTPEPQSYQQPTSAMSPQSPDWQQEEDDEAAQIEGNYNQWNTHTEPNQVDEQIKYHREVNLNAWTNS